MTSSLTWTAKDVAKAVAGQSVATQAWTATGVSIDSRDCRPGDLFIALQGPVHDGHHHLDAAFKKGAAAAIVARRASETRQDQPLIIVKDTMIALEDLGRFARARSQASLIAVTGSVGKTGSKEMLRLMLGSGGDTYANLGSLNNHWGVPLSLARLAQQNRFGVFELGMNHAGELTQLSAMVAPDFVLITTIEAVHLEFFRSLEEIADAKAEIFSGMNKKGTAVLNRDNDQFLRLSKAAEKAGIKKIISFGVDNMADAHLLKCANVEGGAHVTASLFGEPISYLVGAPGFHMALNSLGCLAIAVAAGVDKKKAADALAQFRAPHGRGALEVIRLKEGAITLIDESYNASPASIRAAIKVLAEKKPQQSGRKILVLGDMRELGETSDDLHKGLVPDILTAAIDKVFCCGEKMAHLFQALPPALKGGYEVTSAGLIAPVTSFLGAGDVVSVKGSKTIGMSIIVNAIRAMGSQKEASGKKTSAVLSVFLLFFLSLASWSLSLTPAHANALLDADWSSSSRELLANPPSLKAVEELVNHTLDTDWTLPLCSFIFVKTGASSLSLLASLDVNGRRSCTRVIVIDKKGDQMKLVNDWKTDSSPEVKELLFATGSGGSSALIISHGFSHQESNRCTAHFSSIYAWDGSRFADQSGKYLDFYATRQKDLTVEEKKRPGDICLEMEKDKISRLEGKKTEGFETAVSWSRGPDPWLRRNAAAVFADIRDDASKKLLVLLSDDADPLTAETAELYLNEPDPNKE